MTAIVSRMYIGPPSGSNGASDAHTTWSGPKNDRPHTVAARLPKTAVRHAQDQGVVAGRNAAGASEAYRTVPSFWSEQYDLYIQGVGWPVDGGARVTRPLPGSAALTFQLREGRIVGAMGINVQRDMAAVRRLIDRNVAVDPAALADPSRALAAMLKK